MADPSFVKNARPAGTPAPGFVKDAREVEPEHGMGTQLMDFADEFQDAATFGAGDALAAAELAKFRTVFGDAKLVDIMKTYREERAAQEEARAALDKRDTIGGDIGTVAGIALPAVIGAAAAAPTAAARLGGSATSAGRAVFAPQGAVNVTRLGKAVQGIGAAGRAGGDIAAKAGMLGQAASLSPLGLLGRGAAALPNKLSALQPSLRALALRQGVPGAAKAGAVLSGALGLREAMEDDAFVRSLEREEQRQRLEALMGRNRGLGAPDVSQFQRGK